MYYIHFVSRSTVLKFSPSISPLQLYSVVDETIRGRWQGTSFLTLGWPDILAVGEGPTSPEEIGVSGDKENGRTATFAIAILEEEK